MSINLRFCNPYSEREWWVKHVLFDDIVIIDRFEGLYFLCRFFRPTSIFFCVFLPFKGLILNGNQSKILKSALWTYMTGETRAFWQ